jgi:hypothetical protein
VFDKESNIPAAGKAGTALLFHMERQWRGASKFLRQTIQRTSPPALPASRSGLSSFPLRSLRFLLSEKIRPHPFPSVVKPPSPPD